MPALYCVKNGNPAGCVTMAIGLEMQCGRLISVDAAR